MRFTISKKIIVLLVLMLFVAVCNLFVIYHYQRLQKQDAHIVNVAGQQRMLSQKMAKLSLLIANGNENDRSLLKETIEIYDHSLKIFLQGGKAMGASIPPSPIGMAKLFDKNKAIWTSFKENAEIIINEAYDSEVFTEAIHYIRLNDDQLLDISDEITQIFSLLYSEKILRLKTLFIVIFGFNILVFVVGSFLASRLAKPLRNLSEIAVKIGEGDFTQKIDIPHSNDEINDLANAFDIMIKSLKKSTTSIDNLNEEIAERKRLLKSLQEHQQKLEISQKSLKEFSGKILTIREEEKKILSTNLHDGVGSLAVILGSGLRIVEAEIKDNNLQSALDNIQQTHKALRKEVANLKKMAVDLRPPNLDTVGLSGALREYFSDVTKQVDLKIDFEVNIDKKKLSEDISIALYRVAQEAVNNIIKYAKTKKVAVQLFYKDGKIKFDIQDEGKGFNLEKNYQDTKILKMGIRGMKERIESLGGTFTLQSAPKKGTRIEIILPVNHNIIEGV